MLDYERLERKAGDIRCDIIEMAYHAAGQSHPGPALSCADILAALYFGHMHIRPDEPVWEGRDRFVISKGHACPALYAALAEAGYFGKEHFYTFRGVGGMLQGHPSLHKTPGVDMTSGSLGNGIACAGGMAYALKLKGNPAQVYVLLGDGESQEGLVWEAAMLAPKLGLDNLTVIIDYNPLQSCGDTDSILSMEPYADKWKAFGWRVCEMNGHDMREIINRLEEARHFRGLPTVIIAHTIKGRGVSFMEHNNDWHSKRPSRDQYEQAMAELGGRITA